MSNLQKFNDTITEFEQEVDKLKSASNTYQKLQELLLAYDNVIKQLENNNDSLDSINKLQKDLHQKLQDNLIEIAGENKQHKQALEKLLIDNIDLVRKENKEFYRDLEGTIKIKLDENKSEIKQLIENERSKIKEIFEIEFAKNTNELKSVIESKIDKQTEEMIKEQKSIKKLTGILGGTILLVCVSVLLKLFFA